MPEKDGGPGPTTPGLPHTTTHHCGHRHDTACTIGCHDCLGGRPGACDTGGASVTGHLAVALATASFAPVFPCVAATKRPATPHGHHDATRDADRIRGWWRRNPGHLVAIPTVGLVVVDLDDRPGHPPAWAAWWAMASEGGWDPATTPMVGTPSGGVHIYWSAPPDGGIRNSTGRLAPHIDVRADGGYVIAPGSTLPDGRSYDLLDPVPPALTDAPPWLIDRLTATDRREIPDLPAPALAGGTKYGLTALEAELGRLALAAEGTRNDTLVRAAYRVGQLVAGGQLDASAAASQLAAVASRIGLEADEATATIRSGMAAGTRQPRRPAA